MRWATDQPRGIWAGVLLICAVFAAYQNSLTGPFLFDDIPGIAENPTIRGPLSASLHPPGGGNPVAGRPVANLSFALNHAAGGLEVRGYHVVNLLIHLAAGLVLFGVVRRTLALEPVAGRDRRSENGGPGSCPASVGREPDPPPTIRRDPAIPPYRRDAHWLALVIALLWLMHPLQTEAVTYVIQRTESLAGLFYLLALYGFIRGTEAGAVNARGWLGVGMAAAWLGVATKETVATVPLIVFLYDRTFVAGSFREAWRRHGKFHALLALAWLLLAGLMWQTGGRGGTALWYEDATMGHSLLTQCRAVAGYLQLAAWPAPLVFDYGDYPADLVRGISEVWLPFLLITGLGAATLVALVKWPKVGFLGAWFFLILGPSSSFIPIITQLRAEHRMYLPLAAVVVLAVMALHRFAGRGAIVIATIFAVLLGGVTRARNEDYQSALGLWADTAQKRPDSARARNNHGLEMQHAGDAEGAIREYQAALEREPGYFDAHLNLATVLIENGRIDEGRVHLNVVVEVQPRSSNDCNNLSRLFYILGDHPRTREYLDRALRLDPENYEASNNLGCLLVAESRPAEAVPWFRRSLALRTEAWTFFNLGDAYQKMGSVAEARESFREALRLDPGNQKIAERLRQVDAIK